jgi:hypothetical protein
MITISGIFICVLGAWAMWKSSWFLLLLLVFSFPFSATSVVNWGSQNGLPVSIFFALLYVLRVSVNLLLSKKFVGFPPFQTTLFIIFLSSILFSLLTPYLNLGYTFQAVDPAGSLGSTFSLSISSESFKQTSYFFLWFLVVLCSSCNLKTAEQFLIIVKTVIYSSIFVSIWGWMQVIFSVFGISYPFWLFNNTLNPSGMGYLQKIEGLSLSRMSSVSTEPSIFAAFVVLSISFLLSFLLNGTVLIQKSYDIFIFIFLVTTVLISTATTGYASVVFFFLLTIISVILYKRVYRKTLFWFFAGSIFLMIVFLSFYYFLVEFRSIFDNFIFGKKETFSFIQRFNSTQFALEEFQKFPLNGLGIGSMTVYSLPYWLLANTGIFGFLSFALFYLSLFANPIKLMMFQKSKEMRSYNLATIYSLLTMLFVGFVSGFPYVFGFFWLPIILSFNTNALFRGRN